MNPLTISPSQKLEIEVVKRELDQVTDAGRLREIAKNLHAAWVGQRAASAWLVREGAPWKVE